MSPTFHPLRHLLRAQLLLLGNSLWRRGLSRRLGVVLGGVLAIIAWSLSCLLIVKLFAIPQLLARPSFHATLVGMLVMLVAFTFLTAISFAVSSAYFAKDMEWLLIMPISASTILWQRLIAQLTLGVGVGIVVLGPPVIAMAAATGTAALLPLVILTLIAAIVPPLALGLLLVIYLVRLVPASRVRDSVAGLVVLIGLSVAIISVMGGEHSAGSNLAATVNHLGNGPLGSSWSPTGWAAAAMIAVWRHHSTQGLLYLCPELALAVLMPILAIRCSTPIFRAGWGKAQLSSAPRQRVSAHRRAHHPYLAIMLKDWRVLRRDPVQLSQLILPFVLFGIYLLAPKSPATTHYFQGSPSWYGSLTTSAFASLFVASGLGLRAIGSEGKSFWCLRSAPLSLSRLLKGKLLLPIVAAVLAALLLNTSADLRFGVSLPELAFASLLLTICVIGITLMSVGLGAIWPRLDWTDPRRATAIWLSILFLGIGAAYLSFYLIALTIPLIITAFGLALSYAGAIVMCLLVAAAAGGIAMTLGRSRLRRLNI